MTPTIVSITRDYIGKLERKETIEYKDGDCEIQGNTEKGIWNK